MSIEVMKQALEALELKCPTFASLVRTGIDDKRDAAITALRQAIADQESYRDAYPDNFIQRASEAFEAAKQREWSGVSDERLMEMPAAWVGLTSAEFDFLVPYCGNKWDLEDYKTFAKDIEAKLKEKNT